MSNQSSNRQSLDIEISVLKEEHITQAAYLLSTSFGMHEPIAKALDIPSHDHYIFSLRLAQKTAKDGLSHVAVERTSGMVIGVILSADMVGEAPFEMREIPNTIHSVMTLLDHLDHMYEEKYGRFEKQGEHFHVLCIAIHPDPFYAGRGLAKQLLQANLNSARHRGFTNGLAECTGLFSQRLFRKIGRASCRERVL